MMRRLFIAVREPQQRDLAPGTAEELETGGQVSSGITHRHRNRGKAGIWREQLVVVAGRSIEIAYQARWIAPRGVNERIQAHRVHQRSHCHAELFARRIAGLATRRHTGHGVGRLAARGAPERTDGIDAI